MKRVYSNCKEKGDVTPFWNFAIVSLNEFELIISHNPEPFFRNISNEQFKAYSARLQACVRAARELAKYDQKLDSFQPIHISFQATEKLNFSCKSQ